MHLKGSMTSIDRQSKYLEIKHTIIQNKYCCTIRRIDNRSTDTIESHSHSKVSLLCVLQRIMQGSFGA